MPPAAPEKTTFQEPLAISVVEAGRALGLGRNAAYRAVATGEIPAIRIGGRLLVPVEALRARLRDVGGRR